MYYWREQYFLGLKATAAAALKESAKWQDYGTFCLEYERGLRQQAFRVLERFMHSMEREPFNERRQFVSWLMSAAYRHDGRHMLIPHPLRIRVVEPTLLEWTIVEPDCSEPHRWLGGREHLARAVELDPDDQIALREFIVCLLSEVGYATHELPVGLLGSALTVLETLEKVETLLPSLSSDDDGATYAAEVLEERAAIHEYLAGGTRIDPEELL
jgi:hypothetical protein